MPYDYGDWGPQPVQWRRRRVAQAAPQPWAAGVGDAVSSRMPSWSQPAAPQGYGFTNDPLLRQMRDIELADWAARQRGARSAARTSAGYDPSMASWADVASYIGGGSDVSRNLMGATYGRMSEQDRRKWDEYMMRERAKLEEEMMRRQAAGAIWGDIGQLAGGVAGSWLAPGGFWKGAGSKRGD